MKKSIIQFIYVILSFFLLINSKIKITKKRSNYIHGKVKIHQYSCRTLPDEQKCPKPSKTIALNLTFGFLIVFHLYFFTYHEKFVTREKKIQMKNCQKIQKSIFSNFEIMKYLASSDLRS